MNSRKQLIKEIRSTKAKVDFHRLKADYHQRYFTNLISETYLVIFITLFPVFLLGWKQGKLLKKTGRIVLPFVKFVTSLFFYAQRKMAGI